MGYRSDVRINTTKKGYERLMSLIPEEYREYLEFNLILEEEHEFSTVFGWNSYKWYKGISPDIDAVEDALNVLDKEGYPVEFIRIGEDNEDVEKRKYNNTDDLLYHLYIRNEIDVY